MKLQSLLLITLWIQIIDQRIQASNTEAMDSEWLVIAKSPEESSIDQCIKAILQSEEEFSYWSSIESGTNTFLNWIKENYNPDFFINRCYAKLPIDGKHEHVLLHVIQNNTFKEFARHLTHERTTRWLDRALQTAITGLREPNTRLLLHAASTIGILNNLPAQTRTDAVKFLKNIASAKQTLLTKKLEAYCFDIQKLATLIAVTNPTTARTISELPTSTTITEKSTQVIQKLTELASNKTLPA